MRRWPLPATPLIVGLIALGFGSPVLAAAPNAKKTSRAVAHAKKTSRAATGKSSGPPRSVRQRARRSDAVFPPNAEGTPAFRYAQLETRQCLDEVVKRGLPLRSEEGDWPGISAPMRFTGPLRGVVFRTDHPKEERSSTPFELFDCRLVLALDDFTSLLRAEGITEVVLSSAYRPPPKVSATTNTQGRRHAGGLAVDIHRFLKEDGTWIKVDQDFRGRLGAPVCGKKATTPAHPPAATLRRLVCGASERHLFHSILTPNYDPPHRNHLHLELTTAVRWFIVS